jgi:hypothetical protein
VGCYFALPQSDALFHSPDIYTGMFAISGAKDHDGRIRTRAKTALSDKETLYSVWS